MSNRDMGKTLFILILIGLVSSQAIAKTSGLKEKRGAAKQSNPTLDRLMITLQFSDSVMREVTKVLKENKVNAPLSPFGKAGFALGKHFSLKRKNAGLSLACQKFNVIQNIPGKTAVPQRIEISEACSGRSKEVFSEINIEAESRLKITFHPSFLGDVLGVQSSIFGKPIHCQLETKKSGLVKKMSCKNWIQDLTGGQYVEMTQLVFTESNEDLIVMKGFVMNHVDKIRSIDMKIPLEGKIEIKEIQVKRPDEKAPPVNSSPAKAPDLKKVNPDLIHEKKVDQKVPVPPKALNENDPVSETDPFTDEPVEENSDEAAEASDAEVGDHESGQPAGNEIPEESHPLEEDMTIIEQPTQPTQPKEPIHEPIKKLPGR